MKPYDYKWTVFYESNSNFCYSGLTLALAESELIICSVVIDPGNYSILTTRHLYTKREGLEYVAGLEGATDRLYGNFKGYRNEIFTFGQILLKDGTDFEYFIETGKASMVMVYGVRTLIQTI